VHFSRLILAGLTGARGKKEALGKRGRRVESSSKLTKRGSRRSKGKPTRGETSSVDEATLQRECDRGRCFHAGNGLHKSK